MPDCINDDSVTSSNRHFTLRPARADEASLLSALCLSSKAVWGYDAAFLDACRGELTLTTADLDPARFQVAERDGLVLGLGEISVEAATAWLEKLFIEPQCQGQGIGQRLLSWCCEAACRQGANLMIIEADPGAADFYRRMGAVDNGNAGSGSIPGRVLPRLTMDLASLGIGPDAAV